MLCEEKREMGNFVNISISIAFFNEPHNDHIYSLVPVFQVVRFPNDPCYVTGASKNGTCYTADECSNLGK